MNMNSIKQKLHNVKAWLFDVKEEKYIPRSKYHKVIEKLPLLMAMYGSSVLVAISTYNTFPTMNPFLRYSSAGIGGMAFDVILTATVFSLRKNKFSIMTILAALITGLSIALDLYLHLNQEWLHSLYIVMATLFALHLATTRGLTVEELDKRLSDAERTTSELNRTNQELSANHTELLQTNTELTQTNAELQVKLENHTETIIEKLSTKTDLTANEIVAIVGGTRQVVLEKIKQYRIQ